MLSDDIKKASEINLSELTPISASEKEIELSVLLSRLLSELADRKYWYGVRLQEILLKQEKRNVSAARIEAEAGVSYKNYLELENQKIALIELLRSVRNFGRANREDILGQRNHL